MTYIESPEEFTDDLKSGVRSIFLAGGITNCGDWQEEMRGLLADTDLVLLNPRRKNFPIGDPGTAEAQISWEYRHLGMADEILFWFSCETLCPIGLFELGRWSYYPAWLPIVCRKRIYVGVHPDYARRRDVEIQLELVRPEVEVVYSLEALADVVRVSALADAVRISNVR